MADQRTGDLRQVIYADSQIVLSRDETDSTTLAPRKASETELGTRYRVRPRADPNIDGGQYERLRDRLAEYDGQDGRKARHKADALREALDYSPAQRPTRQRGLKIWRSRSRRFRVWVQKRPVTSRVRDW